MDKFYMNMESGTDTTVLSELAQKHTQIIHGKQKQHSDRSSSNEQFVKMPPNNYHLEYMPKAMNIIDTSTHTRTSSNSRIAALSDDNDIVRYLSHSSIPMNLLINDSHLESETTLPDNTDGETDDDCIVQSPLRNVHNIDMRPQSVIDASSDDSEVDDTDIVSPHCSLVSLLLEFLRLKKSRKKITSGIRINDMSTRNNQQNDNDAFEENLYESVSMWDLKKTDKKDSRVKPKNTSNNLICKILFYIKYGFTVFIMILFICEVIFYCATVNRMVELSSEEIIYSHLGVIYNLAVIIFCAMSFFVWNQQNVGRGSELIMIFQIVSFLANCGVLFLIKRNLIYYIFSRLKLLNGDSIFHFSLGDDYLN